MRRLPSRAGAGGDSRRAFGHEEPVSGVQAIRSKIENPLTGILLNAALVAVGALLLVRHPGETTADHRTRSMPLTNIQGSATDPGFTRAAETYPYGRRRHRGQKRPDVDRLREEYVREARKNVRD